MKKNNFFLILGASLILISMSALSPFKPAHPADAKFSPSQVIALNAINTEMQIIVGKYSSLTAISDPGDVLAYRWLGMAKDYVQLGFLTSTPLSASSVIDTEMANIVAKYGSLTAVTDPGDLLAYRWLAMARQYEH